MSGDVLTRNVKIIAESLARHIFNMTESNTVSEIHVLIYNYTQHMVPLPPPPPPPPPPQSEVSNGFHDVHKDFMWTWLKDLSRQALSPQLVHEDHPIIKDLEEALGRYTHDVTKSVHKPEKR